MSFDQRVLRKTGGSICSAAGCDVTLHPHNPFRWCAQHIDVEYYRVSGRKPPKPSKESPLDQIQPAKPNQ